MRIFFSVHWKVLFLFLWVLHNPLSSSDEHVTLWVLRLHLFTILSQRVIFASNSKLAGKILPCKVSFWCRNIKSIWFSDILVLVFVILSSHFLCLVSLINFLKILERLDTKMYFGHIFIYLFYYITIHHLYCLSVRFTRKLVSMPADFSWEAGYNLNRSPIHHRAVSLNIVIYNCTML